MAMVPVNYRGGARPKGVKGSARVFKSGLFGGLATPIGELRPVDPKLIKNLKMPVENPGLWKKREARLMEVLMYALASDIKTILNAVLSGRSGGSKYGITVAAASAFTTQMRRFNRNKSPLREYGFLQQAMDVDLVAQNEKYIIAVSFDKKKEKSGSRKRSRDANKIAQYIEKGFTITVTEKMRKYFEYQAEKLEESGSSLLRRGVGNFGNLMQSRASAFLYLSTLKPGASTRVPARPFVTPSMKAGIKSWQKKYFQSGVASRMVARQWMRGGVRGNAMVTSFLRGVS